MSAGMCMKGPQILMGPERGNSTDDNSALCYVMFIINNVFVRRRRSCVIVYTIDNVG